MTNPLQVMLAELLGTHVYAAMTPNASVSGAASARPIDAELGGKTKD